jgi:hypothetical protein
MLIASSFFLLGDDLASLSGLLGLLGLGALLGTGFIQDLFFLFLCGGLFLGLFSMIDGKLFKRES